MTLSEKLEKGPGLSIRAHTTGLARMRSLLSNSAHAGSCGICLAAPPTGIGHICPSGRFLGNDKNERLCMPSIVEEVACLAKNPLLNGKDKPNGDFRSGDGKDVFCEL